MDKAPFLSICQKVQVLFKLSKMSTNSQSKILELKYLITKITVLDHGPYGKSRLRPIQQLLERYYCHWTITIDTTVLHESPSFCQN